MNELIQWGGHGGISFFVSPGEIRAFKDLTIAVSAETEDKTNGGEKYTSKKNSGGYKITLTAILNAALGVDVQGMALAITESARLGEQGYFYINGAKLFPSSFMSTDASIGSVTMTGDGKWTYAEVSWTLKQCGKYDDGASGGTSGGGGSGGSGSGGSGSKVVKTGNDQVGKRIDAALDVVAQANKSAERAYNVLTGVASGTNSIYTRLARLVPSSFGKR